MVRDGPAGRCGGPLAHRAVATSLWSARAYRPVVVLSYALTLWYSSGTPLVFHLTNFFIHGVNATLLAALL
jgi:hypothetical protein